jgi:hypothetical protein
MDSENVLDNCDLDISWIEKEEKKYSVESNLYKTHMDSILCYFIYIDSDLSIQKIAKHYEHLVPLNENGEFGIHNDRILQIIQSYRILSNGLKYKIMSISKYLVNLDHNLVYDYAHGENIMVDTFFKELSILEKVFIEPSLPIFHSLNSLYFIFKEDVMVKNSVKSILKIESIRSRTTKKVRILDEDDENVKKEKNETEGKKETRSSNQIRKTRKTKVVL